MSRHTLSVLVSNHSGVLARVAGLISRRGFNIESLAVGTTEHPDVSRMTIVMDMADERVAEQVVKQLNKLIEVYKIVELGDDAVNHEMLMVKVRCTDHNRPAIIDLANLFRAHVVDVSPESVTVEVTGGSRRSLPSPRCSPPTGSSSWCNPARWPWTVVPRASMRRSVRRWPSIHPECKQSRSKQTKSGVSNGRNVPRGRR